MNLSIKQAIRKRVTTIKHASDGRLLRRMSTDKNFVTRPTVDGRGIVLHEADLHENFKDLNPIYFKLRK